MDERGLEMQDKLTKLLLDSAIEEDPPERAASTLTVIALLLEASRELRDEINEMVKDGEIDAVDAKEQYQDALDVVLAAGKLADEVQHGRTINIPEIGPLNGHDEG